MYQFYMDDMLLPVTPGAMTLKVANQNKTVTLINEGEINILKLPGLSKISFNALLPNKEYPFAQYESGFQNAHYYMDKLELLKTKCLPFQFQVIRTDDRGEMLMDSLDMQVSLEEYELEENAEEYEFDVMAKIELLQYKPYGTKTIEFMRFIRGTMVSSLKSCSERVLRRICRRASEMPLRTHSLRMTGSCRWTAFLLSVSAVSG